ncbi:hypothetical protein F5J12DRAFT_478716 [Pisolithus orientalis]|uniref:uncharacterized protein n=1 Tax=Pisolithus orientalis TaxID=936130 RepID=UPI0022243DF4|nr:uncharacterized protein F5J12DRAFT_478716 [Pisolithus orientalis]KAI6019591.1 hypothetical protein F5J12DRAFT_478716 [Pisolithus orientalis]
MNPHPNPLVHAEVFNPRSYTLNNAPELRPAQPKPGLNVVYPASRGKDEVSDGSSLPCYSGFVEQPYSTSAGYTLAPNQISVVYTTIYGTNVNLLECCNRIQHHPNASCAPGSNIMGVATELAKVGDETFQTNPSPVPQKKPRINKYINCPPTNCLYPGPDGKCCLQEVTYATAADHFIIHGITKKSRDEVIPCQWEGCSAEVVRHNFIRHIRERHLGHKRESAVHASGKERGQRTSSA